MRKFTVNKKEYRAVPFDFNLVCDLEDMGVSIKDMSKKPMVAMRAYFALCVGGNKEYAGKEMEEHIKNGGSFEELFNVINAEMEESDFFRSLNKTEEAEVAKN